MSLIIKEEPYSPISEAYRTLRTNIEFTAIEVEHKVIMVTSSGPQEGKSITIANLAFALGEIKKKVLLIDCDMRKPRLHKIFTLSNEKGISNVLAQQYPVEKAIYSVEENVDVMVCGMIPPNPLDLLGSTKMKTLIEKIKERYDYILIDTPPVMAVADAQVLSSLCHGVLLVVAQGKTQKAALTRTKQLIEGVGGELIGVVFTSVNIRDKLRYGYHYYYGQKKKSELRKLRKQGKHL